MGRKALLLPDIVSEMAAAVAVSPWLVLVSGNLVFGNEVSCIYIVVVVDESVDDGVVDMSKNDCRRGQECCCEVQ